MVLQDADLKLKDGRFRLKRSLVEQGGESAARRVFEAFIQKKGKSG